MLANPRVATSVGQLGTGKYAVQHVKRVLNMIENEAALLLDMQHALSTLPPEFQFIMDTKRVLEFIGVRTPQDMDLLVELFRDSIPDSGDFVSDGTTLDLLRTFKQEKISLARRPSTDCSLNQADVHGDLKVPFPILGSSSLRRLQTLRVHRWCDANSDNLAVLHT
eukprot:TRINITY_DN74663_c0_g1_i1.p1 TRINITY_DN74663_c0_g1~~TRINITY_DN74663_c0_g1_i1.p1  ORF type:complete len:189 (-),score=22.07 TRINITY_DN74663_c0_g1_i1:20-517(-)